MLPTVLTGQQILCVFKVCKPAEGQNTGTGGPGKPTGQQNLWPFLLGVLAGVQRSSGRGFGDEELWANRFIRAFWNENPVGFRVALLFL